MLIGDHVAIVGESPVWDSVQQKLWHVDILGSQLVRTDIESGLQDVWLTDGPPGCIAPAEDGGVVLCLPHGLFHHRGAGVPSLLMPTPFIGNDHRYNDGTTDRAGRLIVGTMRKQAVPARITGDLWSFCPGKSPQKLMTGFDTVNGIAFSLDGKTLFISDSHPSVQRIWTAPYDTNTGSVGERRLLLDMTSHDGRPDGAALDQDGGYWIAATEAGCLICLSTNGKIVNTLSVGTSRPSKPVFAGAGLERMFVTTISRSVAQSETKAGRIIELTSPVIGASVVPISWK